MMHFLPKSEAKKIMAGWMAEANGTAKNAAELKEPPEELAKLGPWKCTATTAKAVHVTKTQAAQLAPSILADSDVLRLKNWKTIIRQISNGRSPLAAAILRDVEFWHHQSTNGRWNAALGRYERWVVRSVEGWLDKLQDGDKRPSRRTFIRAKDELVQAWLIEAEGHHWQGKRCLACLAADVLNHLVGGIFGCSRLLRHLDLLIVKMNQKSSLIQILKSVQRALTSDTFLQIQKHPWTYTLAVNER